MVRVTSYSDKIMKILVTGAKGFVGKNLCAQPVSYTHLRAHET